MNPPLTMSPSYKLTRLAADRTAEEGRRSVYYVLGGDHLGVSIGRELDRQGHEVRLIDETCDQADLNVFRGDPSDVRDLEAAEVSAAAAVVVATTKDEQNLLIAQLVRVHFDVENIYVLVHVPERSDLVVDAGHRPICATSVISETVADTLGSIELRDTT